MAGGERERVCVSGAARGGLKRGHLSIALSHWLCFLFSANTYEIQEHMSEYASRTCVCACMRAHKCIQACMCVA